MSTTSKTPDYYLSNGYDAINGPFTFEDLEEEIEGFRESWDLEYKDVIVLQHTHKVSRDKIRLEKI